MSTSQTVNIIRDVTQKDKNVNNSFNRTLDRITQSEEWDTLSEIGHACCGHFEIF